MTGSVFMDTQGLYQRRRAFNMSYRNDLTCNLGEIIPVYWQDLIPNTTWAARVHALVRFMPLVAPILSNVDLYVHFWEAPDRILYGEEFTKVITGEIDSSDWSGVFWTPSNVLDAIDSFMTEEDPETLSDYLTLDGSLFDLLGYDKSLFLEGSDGKLNGRKLLMYLRLIHDWYANENVEPWEDFTKDFEWSSLLEEISSPDYNGDMSYIIGEFVYKCYKNWKTAGLFTHQWPKDYFTSALPTLQYGLPTYLPLGDSAPVSITGGLQINAATGGAIQATLQNMVAEPFMSYPLRVAGDGESLANLESVDPGTPGSVNNVVSISGSSVTNGQGSNVVGVADLSEATAVTMNELRITNALQVFKERELRYGRKPQEYYRGFYGVTPGDLRLQMPKFLGGGRMPVNIADIEQTSQTTTGDGGSPQGNLSGKGTGLAAGFARARCFAPEETIVLGVAWLMPKVLYAQSLSRHDTKLNDRFDYYNPSFAHIGEQPVYNYEVFAGSYGTSNGSKEFGYQPRYTEYRFHNSEIHGDLKGNLSYWTLARIFNSQPALNASFIYMQPEVLNRVFAVREALVGLQRNVILSIQFQAAAIQPLSRYGTPGLMP